MGLCSGYIRDESNHPISGSIITVVGTNITEKTDDTGRYGIALPVGIYTIEIVAKGFYENESEVKISEKKQGPVILMINLKKNNNVWGIPRLGFVLLTGN